MQWNRAAARRRGHAGRQRQLPIALVLGLVLSLAFTSLASASAPAASMQTRAPQTTATDAPMTPGFAPVIPVSDQVCTDPCLHIPSQRGPAVMESVQVYLIFWLPDGYFFAPDVADGNAQYMALIERYFTDIGGSQMYNIVTQYYDYSSTNDLTSINTRYYSNRLTLADSYVDTRPFPPTPALSRADIEDAVTHAMQVRMPGRQTRITGRWTSPMSRCTSCSSSTRRPACRPA